MRKIEIEFTIPSSAGVLFNRLSTASGLAEWFADDVTVDKQGLYHFNWEGSTEVAEQLSVKPGDSVRYRWKHLEPDTYLEFRLKTDPLTSDLALIITDFVEEDEEDEARMLWDSQIDDLKRILGI
jgi:uncharacterized protein YndB with AHSA1/START domain